MRGASTLLRHPVAQGISLRRAALLGFLALAAHLALAPGLPMAWRGLAVHALLMLPGALLALHLFRSAEGRLALVFLALCGAIALPPLLLLALHALPGAIPWWLPLLASDALSAWLGLLVSRDRPPTTSHRPPSNDAGRRLPSRARGSWSVALRPSSLTLGLILALGAALRLPALGSAEFQGDEGRAILMAADLLHGAEDILLLHKKGPVEVLLPAGPLLVTGQINELVARAPFALAGITALLGVYLLARRLLGRSEGAAIGAGAGLVAAAALALDGFMIGFSRIVQYQSVLVLMMCGAIYCAWRFYEGAPHPRRYLCAAAGLAAVGLLAHYDALFALPALLWLALAGALRRLAPAAWPGALLPPALIGAGLVAAFFVPFARNDRFGRTLEYLGGRAGQGDAAVSLYNNLPYYAAVSTFYNTTFAMAALWAALACGVVCWLVLYAGAWGRSGGKTIARAVGAGLAALFVLGGLLALLAPERLQATEELSLAAVAIGLPLAALALAPRTPPGLRALVLWFGAGFAAQSFLVARPNTHFYVMHPAAALLAGLAVAHLWRAARLARPPLLLGGAALLLLALPYAYLLFVRQEPEYRRTFPEQRPAIYAASYGDEVPRFANFGFPHRAGYKVVGELYEQGVLRGSYIANEEELITGWYLRGAFRCPVFADYVLLATHPLDRVRLDEREVRDTYHLLGIVTTDGVGKLEIWSREPVGAEPRAFELNDYARAFDQRVVADFPTQRSLAEVTPQHRLEAAWEQGITLVGYDLAPNPAARGLPADLALYWRTPLAPESGGNGFEPRVQLVDGAGRVVDAAEPYCEPPSGEWYFQWLSGVAYRVPAGLAPGEYAIRVSLWNPGTGATLPLAGGASELAIGTLRVSE
jgi:hypothetical protein